MQREEANGTASPAYVVNSADFRAVVGAQRSLTLDMYNLRSSMAHMSNWRESVETQMAKQADDMTDVKRKLDLLLELQMNGSSRGKSSEPRGDLQARSGNWGGQNETVVATPAANNSENHLVVLKTTSASEISDDGRAPEADNQTTGTTYNRADPLTIRDAGEIL